MYTFRFVGGFLILLLVKKLFDKRTASSAKGKNEASSSSSSATQEQDSSSLEFPSSGWGYEVFLSFRGEDTRTNFTDHLYNALLNLGIHTFRDNEKLRIGEKISPALRAAIHQSKIAIPIFSENYASSKWCLHELAEIVACRELRGVRQITVMPTFYHVDPSDVRNQTGSYEKAFRNYEKKFDQETVKGWKKALREVGELKGWDLEKIADGHEGKLIKLIVKEVWNELRKSPLTVSNNLVGINSHVEEMMKLLNIGSIDTQIVGIHGLGGIGKTTIARCVYNTIYHHFEGCSFIANARETFQQRGLVHLQSQLVMNILNIGNPNISSVDQGIDVIRRRLSNKKVLIVLDDVDGNIDLNAIIGNHDWFGFGSRIIITTRDKHILDVHAVDETYEPNEMNSNQSLQLFIKHAFKMDQPSEHYLKLSKEVVKTTGGLPLALEVIGSFLFHRGESAWKDTVKKLTKIPNDEVQKKLRISYDGLNYEEKEMFLDIACFFIGMNKNIVCYIWHGCDFFPEAGIEDLLLKSLVKIDENNELRMHDQLQDLGREIVRQENFKELGERSRLWSHEEALEVLSTQMGTRKVEGLRIVLNSWGNSQCLMSEGFAAMTKLRLLHVDYAKVAGNFVHSFSELRWLSWKRCPIEFTPTNPRKLAVLDLSYSDITESWMGWNHIKVAETLKVLNLSGCNELSQTPDFSANLHLEVLILEDCKQLATIDTSIGHLKKLVILNTKGCQSLTYLPTSICELSSLKTLDISHTRISQLPETLGRLEALTGLHADYSEVRLPNSIGHLRNLKTLSAQYCNIQQGGILDVIGRLSSLELLRLGGNRFHSLPATVSRLSLLQTLSLAPCTELQSLPELPSSLKSLDASSCALKSLPSLSNLTNLEVLCLNNCENLMEIPTAINALTRLESLSLIGCDNLQYIQHLPSGLTSLNADYCGNVREVSAFLDMRNLVKLCLSHCSRLAKIESLEGLDSLQQLNINYCGSLRKLPKLRGSKKLSYLEFGNVGLSEIEGLEGMYSLEKFIIKGCHLLIKIPNLSDSKLVVYIKIQYCRKLSEIESLEGLDSLEELSISSCPSLRKIKLPKKLRVLKINSCEELAEIEGLEDLESLTRFEFGICESIIRLPDLLHLKTLKHLHMRGLRNTMPLEIGCLEGLELLEELKISGGPLLKILPDISTLKNLKHMELKRCDCMESLSDLSNLNKLNQLWIEYCGKLTEIPRVDRLESLEVLRVVSCKSMESLPDLSNLKKLRQLHIKDCEKLTEIQGVGRLESLEELNVRGCISIETLPCLSKLKNLKTLSAVDCKKLTEVQGADELESLEELNVRGCVSIETLPCLSNLKKLKILSVANCKKLTEIQGVDGLESLDLLNIRGCISIETLPCKSKLTNLKILSAVDCKKLTEVQGADELESLEELNVRGCLSIETLPCLSKLKKLKILSVADCKKLTEIQGVDELESLELLNIRGCVSIETLPCLSKLKKLKILSAVGCKKLTEVQGVDKLESLEELNVSGCISIETIPCLSKLKNLKILSAVDCLKS
ncbi:disease resistance protein L6-like isoform X1 [Telopea speciosissima]|uniref:disease resistance protein L6-like isoform X1 n=1 Tax=Telopea speciosissima TaxID=54955 RepID=UPI001CC42871|nr:disease resistance protein L6-like isoform X1 [Telopea speciosissima]